MIGILNYISQIILLIGVLLYFQFTEYPVILIVTMLVSAVINFIISFKLNALSGYINALWQMHNINYTSEEDYNE